MRILKTKKEFRAEIDKVQGGESHVLNAQDVPYFRVKKMKNVWSHEGVKEVITLYFIYGYVINKSRRISLRYFAKQQGVGRVSISCFSPIIDMKEMKEVVCFSPFMEALNTACNPYEFVMFDDKVEFDRALLLEEL